MKSLTVGNVVSAGLRIYRDHFWSYYKLAFIGCLWAFIPIYGSAKYAAMLGVISRLAFGEVTEKPESIRDAQHFVKPRMWNFLWAGILVSLIISIAMIPLVIIFNLAITILAAILVQFPSAISIPMGILLALFSVFFFIFAFTWLMSHLLMVEVPLAVEENVNASDAISRSWELAAGSIFRLQLIFLVSFLISLPMFLAVQIANNIYLIVSSVIASSIPEFLSSLLSLLTVVISVAGAALLVPFWQSIKAVIYYDLRVRREGLGLNLEAG